MSKLATEANSKKRKVPLEDMRIQVGRVKTGSASRVKKQVEIPQDAFLTTQNHFITIR